jgi:hypothetical protein
MEKSLPGIAIGESDFKRIREHRDCLYVDKTGLISTMVRDKSSVLLFTRPRRFGKTLNLSMLRYFFECENAEENRQLFEGLSVFDDEEAMAKQGQVPVIFISFKDCRGLTWQKTFHYFKKIFANVADNIVYSGDFFDNLSVRDKKYIEDIYNEKLDDISLSGGIGFIARLIYEKTGKKVLLLIDEYDVPLHSAWLNNFWDEAVDFIRSLFSTALKDSLYIEKAVLTGCMRIAKESIFTGVNNFNVYSITEGACVEQGQEPEPVEGRYSSFFGFTESEVRELLRLYGQEGRFDGLKDWYDGYNFGALQAIYNPWSVSKWLNSTDKAFRPHWVNTSGNELIHSILHRSRSENKQQLTELLNGKSVSAPLNEEVVFAEIESTPESIWNFLFASGYLKSESYFAGGPENLITYVNLKIPNKEVKTLFLLSIKNWFDVNNSAAELLAAGDFLRKGEGENFTRIFKKLVQDCFSYFDVGQDGGENFYHGFTLGLMVHFYDTWKIKSNREAGFGRADVLMYPLKPLEDFAVVMEFKRCEKKSELKLATKEALQQIEEKKYEQELQSAGAQKIIKLGMAFCGKSCELKTEVL